MKRPSRMAVLAGGIALLVCSSAEARSIQPKVADDRVVIKISREPRLLLTGDAMVYVADDPSLRFDGDLFRYGQYWYAHREGRWYRALGYDGTFKLIERRRVPRAVLVVPKRFWKSELAQARTETPKHPVKIKPAKPKHTASGTVLAARRS